MNRCSSSSGQKDANCRRPSDYVRLQTLQGKNSMFQRQRIYLPEVNRPSADLHGEQYLFSSHPSIFLHILLLRVDYHVAHIPVEPSCSYSMAKILFPFANMENFHFEFGVMPITYIVHRYIKQLFLVLGTRLAQFERYCSVVKCVLDGPLDTHI